MSAPHLEVETELLGRGFTRIGAIDEVGRGSAFGPVCVGLCVIDASAGDFPAGLRDSKLLSPLARENLVEPIRAWVVDAAVGEASASEIDDFGLTAALRLAGRRALSLVRTQPNVVVLDGSHDWLSTPDQGPLIGVPYPDVDVPPVRTKVKADMTCASVAAASVLAKVYRDRLVTELALVVPGYDLANNKGYATATHLAALQSLGPSAYHRISWKLPPRVVT